MPLFLTSDVLVEILSESDLRVLPATDPGNGYPYLATDGTLRVDSGAPLLPGPTVEAGKFWMTDGLGGTVYGEPELLTAEAIEAALGYLAADDAEVVHLAGTETITGDKRFNAQIGLNGYAKLGGVSAGIAGLYAADGVTLALLKTDSVEFGPNFANGSSRIYGSGGYARMEVYQASGAVWHNVVRGNYSGTVSIGSATNAVATLLAGPTVYIGSGAASDTALIRESAGLLRIGGDAGLRVRNLLNTGDAAITAGAGTYSGNVIVTGTISCPQNTTSERFGANANCGDVLSVAVGNTASCGVGATHGVAIGYGSSTTGAVCTAIGYGSLGGSYASVAIGWGANSGWHGVAIGYAANTETAYGVGGVAIGKNAFSHDGSVAIGAAAATTAAGQCVIASGLQLIAGAAMFSGQIGLNGYAKLGGVSAGVAGLYANDGTTLGTLQAATINNPGAVLTHGNATYGNVLLGKTWIGSTSTFGGLMLKWTGSGLAVRLADDSSYFGILASNGLFSGVVSVTGTFSNTGGFASDAKPSVDNTYDAGTALLRWKDGYFAGTVNAGVVSASTINGVALTTGGSASAYLNGAGSYTTVAPAVGDITGLGTGVAAFLATPSSANLRAAVTDETGTGALVFANTPTLVTPDIGVATGTTLNLTGTAQSKITATTSGYTPALWVSDANSTLGGAMYFEWRGAGTGQKVKAFIADSNGLGFYRMADGGGSFVDSTPDLVIGNANGLVGIRSTLQIGQLNVQPRSTTTLGIYVKGIASQTAALLQLDNSADVSMFKVTSAGVASAVGFTCPTGGTTYAEKFGAGSTASDYGTAVGALSAGAANSVAVGYAASTNYESTAIGVLASGGWRGIAIGYGANTTSHYGVNDGIAIGNSATCTHYQSVVINSASTAANQFITGSAAAPITNRTINGNGGTITIARDGGTVMTWDSAAKATFANDLQQGYASATPSARWRMAASGKRVSEVGNGSGTWQSGYTEEYNVGGVRCALYGATPVAQSTGWAAANYTPTKTIDPTTSTMADLINLVATLTQRLIDVGVISA